MHMPIYEEKEVNSVVDELFRRFAPPPPSPPFFFYFQWSLLWGSFMKYRESGERAKINIKINIKRFDFALLS